MNDSSTSLVVQAPTPAPAPAPTSVQASPLLWSDISLVSVALIWGINIPIMKTGLEQIDLYVFNAIRLGISASALAIFAVREWRRGIRPEPSLRRSQLIVYGLFACALYQVLFLVGISHTTSGNTALIIATVPMWTALLARIFLGESLQRLAWGGLLVALTGTIIVALQKGDVAAGREHLLGNLTVLAAALVWAGGTVYSRPLLRQISPMQLSAWGTALALPVHLLLAMGNYQANVPALASPGLWLILLYSGVLSSGLALPMWNYGVRHAGAAHAAIIQNLVPLVAILAAWFSRGEAATTAQLFGGGLILGGLVIMRLSRLPASRLRSERLQHVPE